MVEIEASRITMEEHAQANVELRKTNEELRKSLHRQELVKLMWLSMLFQEDIPC